MVAAMKIPNTFIQPKVTDAFHAQTIRTGPWDPNSMHGESWSASRRSCFELIATRSLCSDRFSCRARGLTVDMLRLPKTPER